jgi:hypothetical protein
MNRLESGSLPDPVHVPTVYMTDCGGFWRVPPKFRGGEMLQRVADWKDENHEKSQKRGLGCARSPQELSDDGHSQRGHSAFGSLGLVGGGLTDATQHSLRWPIRNRCAESQRGKWHRSEASHASSSWQHCRGFPGLRGRRND